MLECDIGDDLHARGDRLPYLLKQCKNIVVILGRGWTKQHGSAVQAVPRAQS